MERAGGPRGNSAGPQADGTLSTTQHQGESKYTGHLGWGGGIESACHGARREALDSTMRYEGKVDAERVAQVLAGATCVAGPVALSGSTECSHADTHSRVREAKAVRAGGQWWCSVVPINQCAHDSLVAFSPHLWRTSLDGAHRRREKRAGVCPWWLAGQRDAGKKKNARGLKPNAFCFLHSVCSHPLSLTYSPLVSSLWGAQ